MGWDSVAAQLLQQGYVPSGVTPNVVQQEGDDVTARIKQGLMAYQAEQKAKDEEKAAKLKKQGDMYKTLRDSGYDPKSAYKAVTTSTFGEPGGLTTAEQKTGAEVKGIEASTGIKQAQVGNINAAAEVKKAQAAKILEETKQIPATKKNLVNRILGKMAEGGVLTTGEQKVYDEVIRKYGNKSSLEEALGVQPAAAPEPKPAAKQTADEWVPMTDPSGKPKKVHKEDVSKALAQGWKKR